MVYPGSAECTEAVNVGVGIQQAPVSHVFIYKQQPGATYDYTPTGTLISVNDAAGDTATVTAASPSPGSGNCPSTAASCQTITAASGRTLVIGSNSAGLVTSVTDPMGRRWAYAYNTADQLTSATDPLGKVTSYTYGAGSTGNPQLASDLLTITSPNAQPGGPDAGDATVNVYDSSGRVTSQTDPMGNQTAVNYCVNSASGDCLNTATGTGLVTVTDPDGNTTVDDYTQGTQAALTIDTTEATQPGGAGSTVPSEMDMRPDTAAGTLLDTGVTDDSGNKTAITLDALGNSTAASLTSQTGILTATTTSGYAEQDPATEKLPDCTSSAAASQTCNPQSDPGPVPAAPGQVIAPPSQVPATGVGWTAYNTNGDELYAEIGVSQPGGGSAAQTSYDLYNGNSVTLPGTTNPVTCAATAPSSTLPCVTIDPSGKVTQLAYDPAGDLISTSAPDGNGSEMSKTTYTYDADGEQVSTTSPDGNLSDPNAGNFTQKASYDADGHQISTSDGDGAGHTVDPRTTTSAYDADGNVVTSTDAAGNVTTTAYNADDKPALVTDPDGNATLTCYDGDGHEAQVVPPAGMAAGGLTAGSCPETYPAGYSDRLAADATVTTYNGAGLQVQQTTPLPAGQSGPNPYETTSYTYDGDGNLVETIAPPASTGGQSQVTYDTYNSVGKLTTQTTGYGTTAASTVSYCYDPDGNKTSVVYPDGNATGVAPCETSSPWIVSPTAHPTQAAYQTTYSYNTGDELVSTTRPGATPTSPGETTTYTYDSGGDLLSSVSPNGITTTTSYTPLGQVASTSYSGGALPSITYSYDAGGNLTSVADATGTSTRTYDSFGEIESSTNGAGKTINYAYDANGNTTGITYPLPASASWATTNTIGYDYDKAGVLASVTDFNGHTMSVGSTSDGQPSSVSLGSTGDALSFAYGPDDNPSSISLKNAGGSTLQGFGYSYVPDGETLSEADTPVSSNFPAGYGYDARGRLTSMTPGTSTSLSYSYDPSGNLLALPTGASAQTGYGDNGELTASTLAGTAMSYAYDADGNRRTTSQAGVATTSATWNADDQLSSYSSPAGAMTGAVYDADGNRASASFMTSSGTKGESYVWDDDRLLMDSDNAYIYAGSQYTPSEQVNLATGAITYLLSDFLGSIRGTVNSSGTLTGTASYDAWGNPEIAGGLTATTPFGYAGGYTDQDGLVYLINRYYDPQTGQFTSLDPAVGQTLSPYAYTGGDPVGEADPTGMTNCKTAVPSCRYTRGEGFTFEMIRKVMSTGTFANIRFLLHVVDPTGDAASAAIGWFALEVRPNGPWDLKPYLRQGSHVVDGQAPERGELNFYARAASVVQIYYNVWGNVLYGFVGRAEGLGGALLQYGAQILATSTINSPGNHIERQMGINMYDNDGHTPSIKTMNDSIRRQLGGLQRYCDVQQFPMKRQTAACAAGHGW